MRGAEQDHLANGCVAFESGVCAARGFVGTAIARMGRNDCLGRGAVRVGRIHERSYLSAQLSRLIGIEEAGHGRSHHDHGVHRRLTSERDPNLFSWKGAVKHVASCRIAPAEEKEGPSSICFPIMLPQHDDSEGADGSGAEERVRSRFANGFRVSVGCGEGSRSRPRGFRAATLAPWCRHQYSGGRPGRMTRAGYGAPGGARRPSSGPVTYPVE